MELAYDRRAPPALLEVLEPGGWAHSLVEYGRAGQFALDLQLRGYAGKPGHWATLYVGLTKVVDLHYKPSKGFRLDVHPSYRQKWGWSTDWEVSQPGEQLGARWPAVEDYLERVIPSVGSRYLKEGAVQSAISGFASQDLVVIDREAAIAFPNQRAKTAITNRLFKPLLLALDRPHDPAWWKSRPTSLGGECDALAVTRNGHLLAIEVKPAKATATITWAPLQVRHYANLFAEWTNQDWAGQAESACDIIQGMVDQRVRLGLVDDVRPHIGRHIDVQPVIAIGRGYSKEAVRRLTAVQHRLVDGDLDSPPLQVKSVTLAGRLDPIDL
jgi:hypothetical protein